MDIHLVRVPQYVDLVNVRRNPAKWGERQRGDAGRVGESEREESGGGSETEREVYSNAVTNYLIIIIRKKLKK